MSTGEFLAQVIHRSFCEGQQRVRCVKVEHRMVDPAGNFTNRMEKTLSFKVAVVLFLSIVKYSNGQGKGTKWRYKVLT